jgi:hypothetical protein
MAMPYMEGPVRRLTHSLIALLSIALFATACINDEPAARTTPIAVPSGAVSTPSATVDIAPSPSPGRVDGTVAPQNFGATDPVTVKSNPDPFQGIAILRDVRLGVHPEEGGWDRIVFEFAGALPPGSIAYVAAVDACGSGQPVTVKGSAVMLVRFNQATAHTEAGQPTIPSPTIAGPGDTILEARRTCDFEGEVAWALGIKGRQRFKVTSLANPPRVVIDIKQ